MIKFYSYLLLALFAGLLVIIAVQTSPNIDEAANLAAGISIQKYGCFDLYSVNPPLVKFVAAIPLLFWHPSINWEEFDKVLKSRRIDSRPEFSIGHSFLRQNENHIRLYILLARFMCIPFSLLGAYFCWRLARELYGSNAGFIVICLWCLSPFILAWSTLVMYDISAASCGLMSIYFLRYWLKNPKWSEVFYAGLISGIVFLTKFTLLIFYPLFLVLWLLYRKPAFNQLKQLFIIFAMSLLVINMGYLFEDTGRQLKDFKFQTAMFSGYDNYKTVPVGGGNRFEKTLLGYLSVPLPANFIQGIDTQRLDFERGIPSYLRGEHSQHGRVFTKR